MSSHRSWWYVACLWASLTVACATVVPSAVTPSVAPATVVPPTSTAEPPTAATVVTPLPSPSPTLPTPSAEPTALATAAKATATPEPTVASSQTAVLAAARPSFTDVSERTPADAIAYFHGQLPQYPGSSPQSVVEFSSANILETMDTAVLDTIQRQAGAAVLQQVEDVIARSILDTLVEQYGDRWVLVPLDAGHGGLKGYFWDPGSDGTEAIYTRAVVAAMQRLATEPKFDHLILRPIFNDAIPDNFGLPTGVNEPAVDQTVLREARASMLALEAAAWNRAHPALSDQVTVHALSVHFNTGSGGALVLYQGDIAPPDFQSQSLDYARLYLRRVVPTLNATGLLPAPLALAGATGLHDDVMMYDPGVNGQPGTGNQGMLLRYGMLQGDPYTTYYIGEILKNASA